MAQTTKTRVSQSTSPRHGHVFQPASRAYYAWLDGRLDPGALNHLEAGKFFPETQAGLRDPLVLTDEPNSKPPVDGQIASGGNNAARFLDEPRTDWKKHQIMPGSTFTVSWDYSARHVTRRWKYFITRNDWLPDQPLSRAQFEALPFYQVELSEQPYWSFNDALMPPKPTNHELILPPRTGYHVLLAIWEVANTGNAFYQVIDLDFIDDNSEAGTPPGCPKNLRTNSVSEKSVSISWTAATAGSWPITQHKVYRDGVIIALIEAGENQYTDNSVLPAMKYVYSISGIDSKGNESKPSDSLSVVTIINNVPEHNPPTAPLDLHSTEITPNSVTLIWQPSLSSTDLTYYIIYRDGIEIGRTAAPVLGFIDSGLVPSTRYRYFVAAIDSSGKLSPPSNVLAATTTNLQDNDGEYRHWELNTAYNVGDKVIWQGKVYVCRQGHTAQEGWQPDVALSLWLPA